MATKLSKEVRQLQANWASGGTQWPKRLEWLEVTGIRGWTGQRLEFRFPIVALCGENGVGKSTILQAAVSSYRSPTLSYYASQFFPDTPWEKITNATIRYGVREGTTPRESSVRKPTTRWLGNPDRRERSVTYIDLRRTQPMVAQRGFQKLTKTGIAEAGNTPFGDAALQRYSTILGRPYTVAKYSWTSAGANLKVAVVGTATAAGYSGFHQGAGESTIADLLGLPLDKYSLSAIDEVETSLHPRAQRRLIRDLAEVARLKEIQVLLTTHSPYILEELPPEGRLYVTATATPRASVAGISADFAMTSMDDDAHPEGDIYVEDPEARHLLSEILFKTDADFARRVQVSPAGAASVVRALGLMVAANRFPRPTAAVLDGDQSASQGCVVLPGGDAPERVILGALKTLGFPTIAAALSRNHTALTDATEAAMTLPDHHEWVPAICDKLLVSRSEFWGACVRHWVENCLLQADREALVQQLKDTLNFDQA